MQNTPWGFSGGSYDGREPIQSIQFGTLSGATYAAGSRLYLYGVD
jgi:hypothetical protein